MNTELLHNMAALKAQQTDDNSIQATTGSKPAIAENVLLSHSRFGIADLWKIRGRKKHISIFRNKIE